MPGGPVAPQPVGGGAAPPPPRHGGSSGYAGSVEESSNSEPEGYSWGPILWVTRFFGGASSKSSSKATATVAPSSPAASPRPEKKEGGRKPSVTFARTSSVSKRGSVVSKASSRGSITASFAGRGSLSESFGGAAMLGVVSLLSKVRQWGSKANGSKWDAMYETVLEDATVFDSPLQEANAVLIQLATSLYEREMAADVERIEHARGRESNRCSSSVLLSTFLLWQVLELLKSPDLHNARAIGELQGDATVDPQLKDWLEAMEWTPHTERVSGEVKESAVAVRPRHNHHRHHRHFLHHHRHHHHRHHHHPRQVRPRMLSDISEGSMSIGEEEAAAMAAALAEATNNRRWLTPALRPVLTGTPEAEARPARACIASSLRSAHVSKVSMCRRDARLAAALL